MIPKLGLKTFIVMCNMADYQEMLRPRRKLLEKLIRMLQ